MVAADGSKSWLPVDLVLKLCCRRYGVVDRGYHLTTLSPVTYQFLIVITNWDNVAFLKFLIVMKGIVSPLYGVFCG